MFFRDSLERTHSTYKLRAPAAEKKSPEDRQTDSQTGKSAIKSELQPWLIWILRRPFISYCKITIYLLIYVVCMCLCVYMSIENMHACLFRLSPEDGDGRHS